MHEIRILGKYYLTDLMRIASLGFNPNGPYNPEWEAILKIHV